VLEAGIRRHPSDFWMHFELGWAYWFGKPQRLDLALGCFRTAVALRLNVAAAWHFLTAATAEKAKMAGRTSEPDAIAALKERVKANPDDFAVRRELGLLLFNNTRDYAGAAEVFRDTHSLQTGNCRIPPLTRRSVAMGKPNSGVRGDSSGGRPPCTRNSSP